MRESSTVIPSSLYNEVLLKDRQFIGLHMLCANMFLFSWAVIQVIVNFIKLFYK